MWRHPKSGKWHCIDYVLMQQKHRSSCLDVSVKRGAVCDTDHNMVCLKLRLKKPHKRKQRCVTRGRRFDVTQLRTNVDGELLKLKFVNQVLERPPFIIVYRTFFRTYKLLQKVTK